MKKLLIGFTLLLASFFVLNFVEVKAEGVPTYDLTFQVQFGDGVTPNDSGTVNGIGYGQTINIDVASWDDEEFDFLGYIVQGKVSQSIQHSQSFRMTENMDIVAYFKPVNSTAVIFMDSNHDFITVKYTDGTGVLTEVPGLTGLSKPGLTASGWNIENIASHVFTEDTIVYLEYANNSGVKTLTYDEGLGVETSSFDYNSLVTLTANGSGDFSYWLKDGIIASLNETYTFTMIDDHTVEAVYDDSSFVPDSDTIVTVSSVFNIETDYDTIVGQFHLGENEEVIEWGLVESSFSGGITFDTPDVDIFWSTRYNETSNEFMMSFNQTSTDILNYRGFVTTINTLTDEIKTTYSYYQETIEEEFASDLIISEYLDWNSGTNKAIELYNGTSQVIDLSNYSIKTAANGATSWTNTTPNPLVGNIQPGEAYVLENAALTEITSIANSHTTANFNGNDAIGLFKNGVLIDIFGVLGEDPGTGWSIEGGNTADSTVIRKSFVNSPFVDNSESNPKWNLVQWVSVSQTVASLGTHTMDLQKASINVYTNANTPSSITITGDTSVNMNESIQLSADIENVIWVSSDTDVMTVDQTGLVTGVSEGEATVYAFSIYNHNVIDSKVITVNPLTTYDVTFNNDGVTNVVNVDGGDPVTEPTDPTKEGYVFEGWFTSNDSGVTLDSEWNFATGIQDNLTLYAKWVEISSLLDLRTDGTAAYIQGIVTGKDSGSTYINDGTAAIAIYNWALFNSTVTVGDEILFVTNTTSSYNELLQLSYNSYEVLSSSNDLPDAVVLNDLSEVTSSYQTQRVSISGLEVVSVVGSDLTLTDGTTQVVVYGLSSEFLATIAIGQNVNLVSIHVGWFNGLEFNVLSDAEVELVPLSDAEKVAGIKAELLADFNGNEYASNSTITLPSTSTVYGGTITWSSSNETLVNSTTGAIGEAATDTLVTLTAFIDVNGTTDTQDVAITVIAAGTITETTVTASYTDTTTTNMVDGNNATSLNLDPLVFNVVSTKRVVNPLHVGLNKSGQIRLYNSSDSEGNILTISIDSAYTITSIEIVFGTSVTDAEIITGTTTQLSGTLTSEQTLTYTGLDVSEFSIQNIGSSQIYILSITITYIINPEA